MKVWNSAEMMGLIVTIQSHMFPLKTAHIIMDIIPTQLISFLIFGVSGFTL
jgi:hypothetical protein